MLCCHSDWDLEEEPHQVSGSDADSSVSQPHLPFKLSGHSPEPQVVAMETDKEEGNPLQSASSSPHSLNLSMTSDPGHVTAETADIALPLRFLCDGHAQLGRMGWCCRDSGTFLLESVSVLRRELRVLTKLPPKQREVQYF